MYDISRYCVPSLLNFDLSQVQLTKTILKVVNDVVQCEGLLGAVQKNVELLDTSLGMLN